MATRSTFWFRHVATRRPPSVFWQGFLARLIAQFGQPRVVITDKLRSNIKPIARQAPGAHHRAHKGLNNRIEGSHRPTRRREKIMGRFKSPRQAQRFLAAHDQINAIFKPAAIASPLAPIVMQGLMPSASGPTMPAR
jgi:transposase-like protein